MNMSRFRLLRLTALAASVFAAALPSRALTDESSQPADSEGDSGIVTHNGRDQVAVFGSTAVAKGDTVIGDNVTVFGSAKIDGTVTHDVVTVFGTCRVNGHVDHDLVCVFGDLWLGPAARVEHDVVCMGSFHREPGSIVGGRVVMKMVPGRFHPGPGIGSWWQNGLQHGRILTFGPHLTWVWVASLIAIGLYALVALLVPGAVQRAGDVLVESPGVTILIGLAAIVAVPLVSLLLFVTVVGIPVVIFLLPMALIVPIVFGRAALYALIGRRLFGRDLAPAGAVMIGGGLVVLMLLIPVLGIIGVIVLSFIAWCCGWTGLILRRSPAPAGFAPPPPVQPVVPPAPVFAAAPPAAVEPPPPASSAAAASPSAPAFTPPMPAPLVPAATMPRAGFWIRAGAMAIDVCLVGVLCGILDSVPVFGWLIREPSGPGPFLLLCATYAAILWKLKGATIGGLICHLSLVRIDGRPVDWTTAIVRALGCFISVFAIGLGFIWVAFDPERQSWHDKIAGTTVVIPPRRQSLV